MTPEARLILAELVYEGSDPGNTPSLQCARLMQEHLNFAYLTARSLGGTALDNIMFRPKVRAVFPYGYYALRDALVIPPHVEADFHGKVVRAAPGGGTVSHTWDGTYEDSLRNIFRPCVILSNTSMLDNLPLKCDPTALVTDAGAGVVAGKNWGAASVALSGGAGYSVGDVLVGACPERSPFFGFEVTVTAVDGAGKPTAWTLLKKGCYPFPVQLQKTIWTAANGFNVFNGIFEHRTTGGTGAGATGMVTWESDFPVAGGRYRTANNVVGDTVINRLRIHGVGTSNDVTYGPHLAMSYFGLNHTYNEIQVVGGYAGFDAYFANDIRGNILNTVLCGTALNLFEAHSFECPIVVTDSSKDADIRLDRSSEVRLDVLSFYSTGNTGIVSPFGAPLRIGAQSSGAQRNDSCSIRIALKDRGAFNNNNGTQPAGTFDYSRNCTFEIEVSNGNRAEGGVYFTPFIGSVGANFEASNTIRGRIDKITANALFTGAGLAAGDTGPRCDVEIWDAALGAKMGWGGRYDIKGSGAPSDGGAGTGAKKAAQGSKYIDVSAGNEYINAGTAAAPAWKMLTRAA